MLLSGEAMFATPAYAQALGGGAPGGAPMDMLIQFLPLVGLVILFYFLMIRPQQRRMKSHQTMLAALKRGDNVVLSSGVQGKIVRVEDADVGVEIATGVTVKVRKAMISEVQTRAAPAPANDSKT
jgi:preprotein translocase subunit YajC